MRRIIPLAFLIAVSLFVVAGCGSNESPSGDGGADGSTADSGSQDAGVDGGVYSRPEKGDPVSDTDIKAFTQKYIDVLKYMDYFTVMDDRVHGWPESETGGYWYGTWWSGIDVTKKDGVVTFLHGKSGADNNGMRVAPMLSATAFAWKLWGKPAHQHLVRKILRGFNAWILAMEIEGNPNPVALMTRAHYPLPVHSTDGERNLYIDYSLNRPGEDNGACKYVHITDNPYWGDIWVKNMRSKDDIGHMFTELPLMGEMMGWFDDAELRKDYDKMIELYSAWSRQVEADGFRIATYDKNLGVYLPEDDLAILISMKNLECPIIQAIRFYGKGDPGDWKCGNGISELEPAFTFKNDNAQQFRSFHEADVAAAKFYKRFDIANKLLPGLAERIDTILDAREGPTPPVQPGDKDLSELVLMSANVGLPLTWREVRYLHSRIQDAFDSFRNPAMLPSYKLFDSATPDGKYNYDIEASGYHFRHLGSLLGECASPYRNPTSKPYLDCDMIKNAYGK
jgi:hypothetical protein